MRISSLISLVVILELQSFAGDVEFKKHVLSAKFYSEGCAVADVDKDGKVDVLSGPYWYEAPEWTPHEIREPKEFKFDGGYSDSFINGSMDVNQDGWEDFILVGFPGAPGWWFENPKGEEGHWRKHAIWQSVCNESPHIADLDGDGRDELVFPSYPPFKPDEEEPQRGQWAWFQTSPEESGSQFTRYPFSDPEAPGSHKFSHGMGIGDVNGDGRNDVVVTEGWWEAPPDYKSPDWKFHPANLGPACAHMFVYDFDEDGDSDIVSSSAHNYGIWWYEQGRSATGETVWAQHVIREKEFSQTHSLCFADINEDGLPDLVTGKRFYAHNGHDPGAHEPAVLCWLEFQREGGAPKWITHQIDDDSGVGTQFVVEDITGDGKLDIVTSNKKGTFVFENVSD